MKEITKKNWLMMIGGLVLAGLFLWLGLYALKELPINISTKVKPGIYLKIEASLDNSAWHTILQNRGTETLGNVHRTIYDGNNLYLSGDIFNNITACEPLYIRITNLTAKSDVTGNLATAGPALNAYFSDKNGVASYPSYGVENINFASSNTVDGGSKTFVVVPNTVMLNNQFTFYLHVSLSNYISTEYAVTQNLNSVVESSNNFNSTAVSGNDFETTLTPINNNAGVCISQILVGTKPILESASGYSFNAETGKLIIFKEALLDTNGDPLPNTTTITINATTKPEKITVSILDCTASQITLNYENHSYVEGETFQIPSNSDFTARINRTDPLVAMEAIVNGETVKNYFNPETNLMRLKSSEMNANVQLKFYNYWDGTVATQFAGGTGIETDPYQISNGNELALLASIINRADDVNASGSVTAEDVYAGTNYHVQTCRTAHYEITNDIYLNDDTFAYNSLTGYVEIMDGINNGKIGTGLNGTIKKSGIDTYTGTLNEWPRIGSHIQGYSFEGVFNGNNNIIYNMSIFENEELEEFRGLFSRVRNGIIKNIGVENCLIGDGFSGPVIGWLGDDTNRADVINCYSKNAIIIGDTSCSRLGGICGNIRKNTNIINCYSVDAVLLVTKNSSQIGGICGLNRDGNIINCYSINAYSPSSYGAVSIVGSNWWVDGILTEAYCYGESGKDIVNTVNSGDVLKGLGTFTSPSSTLTNYASNTTAMTSTYQEYNLPQALNAWLEQTEDGETLNNRELYGIGTGTWQVNDNINRGFPYFA